MHYINDMLVFAAREQRAVRAVAAARHALYALPAHRRMADANRIACRLFGGRPGYWAAARAEDRAREAVYASAEWSALEAAEEDKRGAHGVAGSARDYARWIARDRAETARACRAGGLYCAAVEAHRSRRGEQRARRKCAARRAA